MLFGLPYYIILVIPLAGSLFVPLIGRLSQKLRDWTPAILMGITMILCWSLLLEINNPQTQTTWMWIPSLHLEFGVLLDPLSVIMAVLASTLCFLIYVYSTEYMAHEEDKDRFFFLMLAFGGGMLTLVLSNNLLIGFIGWEIMGFCSYGLIGFWNDKRNPPEEDPTGYPQSNPLLNYKTEGQYNTHCGTKAFIVTRIGDAFMLGGILLLFLFTGTFMFTEMAESGEWFVAMVGAGMLIPTFLLIFMGAIGKSGQAPLQVWLPEAMAGPTAVSALIHAATMVKAGVYISARFLITLVEAAGHIQSSLISLGSAQTFFLVIAVIGAITAFMTATMGMTSNEMKQVLAFSTLSQLGYMMLAIGVGGLLIGANEHLLHAGEAAYLSSVLHVISHGAFKALLFLAAGGVIHAVHTKYMTKMGGLKKYMPRTLAVMWIGVAALAGIPPFSGFWSKDSIIEYTYELAVASEAGVFLNQLGMVLFILAVLAAMCTIFYSIRLMGIVFYGHEEEHHEMQDKEAHNSPHDPGPAMMIPLYILAGFTLIAFLIYPIIQNIVLAADTPWDEILMEMIIVKITMPGLIPFGATLAALALGGIPAYMIYIKGEGKNNALIPERGVRRRVYSFLKHRWYINEFYYWVLYKFLRFVEWWRVKIDNRIIDGIDFGSSRLAQTMSRKIRWFDDHVIDGFAEGVATQSVQASRTGMTVQTGRINDYVAMIIFGLGVMIIILLVIMGVL